MTTGRRRDRRRANADKYYERSGDIYCNTNDDLREG
jgi:hypothetical protein